MTDEEQVLSLIHDRLLLGERRYGRLCIDGDPRDWLEQALEEHLDAVVYCAVQLVKIRRARLEPKHDVRDGDLAQCRAALVRAVSAYDDGAKSDLARAIDAARELVRG